MKRILAVLALLTAFGMAFSVTGQIRTCINPDGTGYAVDNYGVDGPYKRTGFDLNFDGFTFTYQLTTSVVGVGPLGDALGYTVIGAMAPAQAPGAGAYTVPTSPGFFEIAKINLGPISGITLAAAWFVADETSMDFSTNRTTGATNQDKNFNSAYNRVLLNTAFNIPVSDQLGISIDYWDRAYLIFEAGSSTLNDTHNGVTNVYNGSTWLTHIPVYISYNMDALSLTLKPGIEAGAYSTTGNTGTSTNNQNGSTMTLSLLARFSYKVNANVSVYAHAGIENISTSAFQTTGVPAGVSTNVNSSGNVMSMPLKGGVALSLAPGVTFNLGLGYVVGLGGTITDYTGNTNVKSVNTSGFYTTYGGLMNDNMWSSRPFINVGGSAKFNTDWEVGWTYQTYFVGKPYGRLSTGFGNNFTDSAGKHYDVNNLVFNQYTTPDDLTTYIQYTKDNVTLRGAFGGSSAGPIWSTGAAAGVFGAFAHFDIIYNF